ncbi:hypothetical protein BHM03_00056123 [Ensete ventricosum]|nr:hypothetical protein BHM03_00056123 [Ensete ventricosum]
MSYARSLSCTDDELRIFRSCLKWTCVDQSDAQHTNDILVPLPHLGRLCSHSISRNYSIISINSNLMRRIYMLYFFKYMSYFRHQ